MKPERGGVDNKPVNKEKLALESEQSFLTRDRQTVLPNLADLHFPAKGLNPDLVYEHNGNALDL